ncbi:MAG: molybdate ABC transporter substrate-binding protein [Dehalococcoidia bacterium]
MGPKVTAREALALVLLVALLTACGSSSNGNLKANPTTPASAPAAVATAVTHPPATTPPATNVAATAVSAPKIQGQLTVFAAASLTDTFKQMGSMIEQANPGTKVTFNFAGSPTLRTQLSQGARADVFASADEPNMQGAQQDGTIAGAPRIFAQNRLVVIAPAKSTIAQLQDLAKPGTKVVLAQQSVPVGNYARQSIMKMSLDPAFGSDFNNKVVSNVVSDEQDVKGVVTKVQLGEADAGFVYTTDVTPAVRGQVKQLVVPDAFNVIARYPIAAVKGAPNAAGAQAFIDFVLSSAGQAILKDAGFIPPPVP